jgi:CYTH domain-containing protein
MLRRVLAFEEISNGKAFREIEHVFYARLSNIGDLAKAASQEHQEQWELKFPKTNKNGGSGTVRIRKTIIGTGVPAFVLTTKTMASHDGDKIEVPVPTTEPMFKQFKLMSEKGMIKDRYHFPIEGTDLVWEVDMFLKPGGQIGVGPYEDWCKIDLEVSDRLTTIPPFPLDTEELITAPFGKRTEEEEAKVTSLYETVFTQKNLFLQSQ